MSTPTFARSGAGSPWASGAQMWSWTYPGAPICINLSRSLVARLQSDVDTRTRAEGDSGRELGGLLFGHPRGNESIVDIDDYVWLPSAPGQNGSYNLNTAEIERLREERKGSSSMIVGYFRTDFGATLELRDAEIDLIGREFSDPTNVVLLICSSRPHTGGFFFWMGEGVMSPFSLMDFPLDVMRLPFHDDPHAAAPPAVTSSLAETPSPRAAPAAPEMDDPSDAPFLDDSEELVPWPVLDSAPKKLIVPAPVVQMPAKPAPAPPPPVISIDQPQAEKPSPARDTNIREASAHESAVPVNNVPANSAPSRANGILVTAGWTLALLIGLCLSAGVIVIAFRGGPSSFSLNAPSTEPKPQSASVSPFQLNVEAQGTGLNIRWDARSAAIAQAREGQLTISEANKTPAVIPLTAQQLTIGHIYFQSAAERLEVQLEAVATTGGVSRESVLALSSIQRPAAPVAASATTAAASQQAKAVAAAPPVAPVRKVETIPIPAKTVSDSGPPVESKSLSDSSTQSRPIARTFTAPASNRSPVRVPVIDQLAMPTVQPSQPTPMPMNIAANNGVLATRLAPPPPAPAPAAAAVPQTAPQPLRVTSSLQAAKLVRKVSPVYPQVAIAGHVQGLVKFTAVISKEGTIANLQMMGGPSVFAKPAMDAVRQWVYQPTLLNGAPVEVVTEIDVNFTLSQ